MNNHIDGVFIISKVRPVSIVYFTCEELINGDVLEFEVTNFPCMQLWSNNYGEHETFTIQIINYY